MWQYNNIKFMYANPVAGVFGQEHTIPKLITYVKSKYALMEVIREYSQESLVLGPYTEIDQRTVKHDKPIKV